MMKVDTRTRETSATTGAGTYALDGAPTGFLPFSGLGANTYTWVNVTNDIDFEEGLYQVLAGNQLSRIACYQSTNAGAFVNWGVNSGTKKVRCVNPAKTLVPRKLSKAVGGGAGTTVLTMDEQLNHQIEFTGVLTGNRIIEVAAADATPWTWIIYNNTTGAFSLTFRVTGQTGVVVPQARRALLYGDTVDVRPAVSSLPSGSEFAAGTAMVFNQTAAPTGWTKSATHNDKALRVVSGTVGSGGATAFTSVFGAGKSAGNYTLATADIPAHAHTSGFNTGAGNCAGGASVGVPSSTDNTGGGGAHSHSLSLDLHYVDVMIATKD